MATEFVRTIGNVAPDQLRDEINGNTTFIVTCVDIIFQDPDQITVKFNTDPSGDEVSMMDTLIAAHVPESIEVSAAILPKSPIDNFKLAVHTSYKPENAQKQTYAVWTGAGDDLAQTPDSLGKGDLLVFCCEPGTATVKKELKFDPVHGRVWVHEGYMNFSNGGPQDYMDSSVIASPTPLQQAVNLDLIIQDNWVKFAPGGPGTGTHGFAGTPILIPRSFSMDGDWDYDGVSLTPNLTSTGAYSISDIKKTVHHYFNKIPVIGSSPYFSMTSDETTELPSGYYIEITAHNVSDTTWCASIIIEIYRERTYLP